MNEEYKTYARIVCVSRYLFDYYSLTDNLMIPGHFTLHCINDPEKSIVLHPSELESTLNNLDIVKVVISKNCPNEIAKSIRKEKDVS